MEERGRGITNGGMRFRVRYREGLEKNGWGPKPPDGLKRNSRSAKKKKKKVGGGHSCLAWNPKPVKERMDRGIVGGVILGLCGGKGSPRKKTTWGKERR